MRSARLLLVVVCLMLVALPLALLAVAWGYEQVLRLRLEAQLQDAVQEVLTRGPSALEEVGHTRGVELVLVDARGEVEARSHVGEEAFRESLLGGPVAWLLDRAGVSHVREPLEVLEASWGPYGALKETRAALAGRRAFALRPSPSGQSVSFHLAVPRPEGGAVHAIEVSRRGVRRLLALQDELLKLTGYQAVLALVVALLLNRWLVRPLEELARGAVSYPHGPLAGAALLGRRDELGQLSRALVALTQSLEEKRRATVDLAADVAHEFKNPLATIAASAELLGTGRPVAPERLQTMTAHIAEAVERLRANTDALLSLVRLEAALPEEKRARVDYAALLEEVLEEYRDNPRHAHVTLTAQVAPEVGEVLLVPEAWSRLLRNLLDNALVQPASQPEVQVRAWREGEGVCTEVSDFGPGISPGNRDKVFRRFFTHRPEGTPPGTGLGLSIVQTVAAAHGGRVTLEEGPTPGATFRVTLPA